MVETCGNQDAFHFHEAMGMVDVKDAKDLKPSAHSIKMPPLDQPRWFQDAVTELESSRPPAVGPQVFRTKFFMFVVA